MLFIQCIFLQLLIHQPTYAFNKIHSEASTCFDTGVPSSGSYSEQRSTRPARLDTWISLLALYFFVQNNSLMMGTPVPKHVGVLHLLLNVFY
jgi:hypothetical protein